MGRDRSPGRRVLLWVACVIALLAVLILFGPRPPAPPTGGASDARRPEAPAPAPAGVAPDAAPPGAGPEAGETSEVEAGEPAAPATGGTASASKPTPDHGAIAVTAIDTVTRAPLAGVTVRVATEAMPVTTAATDAGGAAHFEDLPPGDYAVAASVPRHTPLARSVSVGSGETANVCLELVPGGSIAGVVRDAATGSPVAGALVVDARLRPRDLVVADVPERLRERVPPESLSETGDDGAFALAYVDAGSVRVRAVHPSYRPAEVTVEVLPAQDVRGVTILIEAGARIVGHVVESGGGPPPADLSVVALGEGSMREVAVDAATGTFELPGLAPGRWSLQLADGQGHEVASVAVDIAAAETRAIEIVLGAPLTVEGTVTRRGQPVPRAEVSLVPVESGLRRGGPSARTNDEGHYEIEGIQPGSYVVFVEGGGGPERIRLPRPATIEGGTPRATLDIEIPAGAIEGTISDRTTGRPPERSFVVVLHGTREPGDRLFDLVAVDHASPDGSFRIEGLATGTYRVVAAAPGLAQDERLVEVVEGGATPQVDLVLGPGCTLSGVVRGPDGRPRPGAVLWIEREDTGTVDIISIDRVRSDADGTWRVESLASASYRVTACLPGEAAWTERVFVGGAETHVEIQVPGGATLDVRVTGPGGGPVPGAFVRPVHLGSQPLRAPIWFMAGFADDGTGTVDASGHFVRGSLPPGPYRIEVEHPAGHVTTVGDVRLVPGETTVVEVAVP